jgi:hypothetical protein
VRFRAVPAFELAILRGLSPPAHLWAGVLCLGLFLVRVRAVELAILRAIHHSKSKAKRLLFSHRRGADLVESSTSPYLLVRRRLALWQRKPSQQANHLEGDGQRTASSRKIMNLPLAFSAAPAEAGAQRCLLPHRSVRLCRYIVNDIIHVHHSYLRDVSHKLSCLCVTLPERARIKS